MVIKKISERKLSQVVLMFMLFFAFMNFRQSCFYFIYIAVAVTIVLHYKSIIVNYQVALLLLFSTFYVLFNEQIRSNTIVLIKHFAYPMCYLVGMIFLNNGSDKRVINKLDEKQLITAITIISMGPLVHYLMNFYINIGSLNRNTIDVWSGQVLNATGQSSLAVLAIAFFSVFLFAEVEHWKKGLSFLILVAILGYNMVLAGRTIIFILVIILLTAFTMKILYSNSTKKKYLIVNAVLISMLFLLIYLYDIFGIREKILGSNLSLRLDTMQLMEDSRFEKKLEYISLAYEYPWGNAQIRSITGSYAHGLLLDTFSESGVIAFLCLLCFLVVSLKNTIRVLKYCLFEVTTKSLLLCISIVFYILFLIEPILIGMPWFFCAFCFVQGMLDELLAKNRYAVKVSCH